MRFDTASGKWEGYRFRLVELGLVALSTHANQSQICLRLCDRLGDKQIDEIRKSDVEIYIGERLQTCAPVTVQGEVNVLAQVLTWCVDEQLLAKKPRIPSVNVPNQEEALPPDEAFVFVIKYLPQHHGGGLEFMMLMGLSPHELERVQVQDVIPQPGFIQRVHHDMTPIDDPPPLGVCIGGRADFATKTAARRRWVPMSSRAEILWTQASWGKASDAHPFPRRDAMEKAIQRLRENCPVPVPAEALSITPKMMRSWFASKVAEDNPEHVLQRLLGHVPGSKVTRRHYVRSSDARLVDATAGLRVQGE